jgi:hypothetical protein
MNTIKIRIYTQNTHMPTLIRQASFEVFTAVWLSIPFYYDMTGHRSKWFPTFHKDSSSNSTTSKRKTLDSFEISGTNYPEMQDRIPEELN